jgi:hypothetical protein
MRTHGLDWRQKVRASTEFVALVTPAWLRDGLMRRQLAYARELGKPIYLLVKQGTRLPADVRGEARVFTWVTTEDLATLVREIAEGER